LDFEPSLQFRSKAISPYISRKRAKLMRDGKASKHVSILSGKVFDKEIDLVSESEATI